MRKNILIVASESDGLAKTGGLADVVAALPRYLAELGYDARIIMPYHSCIKQRYDGTTRQLYRGSLRLGWREQYLGLELLQQRGVKIYLVDNNYYFGHSIYEGGEKEIEQYAFFSCAVEQLLDKLSLDGDDFFPQVLHLNDWHSALLPLLLLQRGGKSRPRCLLTIHNLAYQGRCSLALAQDLLSQYLTADALPYLEHYGAANFLKAGCALADAVNTVSPSYANEILTVQLGEGLDGVLLRRKEQGLLYGILNGLDCRLYDPAWDEHLPINYSVNDIAGKKLCKLALQRELGLTEDEGRPLLAMVSRLSSQKAPELVLHMASELVHSRAQLVVLGSGERWVELALGELYDYYHGSLFVRIGYDDALARRIYAGSDMVLMPSRFEPCGLTQLIAMRYGSLPIVHETGGLRDTVQAYDCNSGTGTGFSFAPHSKQAFAAVVRQAVDVYRHNQPHWQNMLRAAMSAPVDFAVTAGQYAKLYEQL